jgi:tetratricopeptide (TPR) repeat protein
MGQIFSASNEKQEGGLPSDNKKDWKESSCRGDNDNRSTNTTEATDDVTTWSSDEETSLDSHSSGASSVLFPFLESALLLPEQAPVHPLHFWAKAHNDMASMALALSDYPQALSHSLQVIFIVQQVFPSATNEAWSFELDRTHRFAKQLSSKTSRWHFQNGSATALLPVWFHEQLGLLWAHLEEHRRALLEFRRARAWMRKAAVSPRRLVTLVAYAAAACSALGDFQGAVRECQTALWLWGISNPSTSTTTPKEEDWHLKGCLHHMLGVSYLQLQEWDKAFDNLRLALPHLPSRMHAEVVASMSVAHPHLRHPRVVVT